jgi:hypothetical protein
MSFDPTTYGAEVARILALDGDGMRLMPLDITGQSCSAASVLRGRTARELFPDSFAPEAALSGLWLYFSCFEESHSLAQDIESAEGSYWHGILHRQEPDPGNAGYWFRRVGRHAIFPPLLREAAAIFRARGMTSPLRAETAWDPFAFIDFCETARRQPNSAAEQAAREIQRAEWQLLFDYCARPGAKPPAVSGRRT